MKANTESSSSTSQARIDSLARWFKGALTPTLLLLLNQLHKLPVRDVQPAVDNLFVAAVLAHWIPCFHVAYHCSVLSQNPDLLPQPKEKGTVGAWLINTVRTHPGALKWLPLVPPVFFALLSSGLLLSTRNALAFAFILAVPVWAFSSLLQLFDGVLTRRLNGQPLSLPHYMVLLTAVLGALVAFLLFVFALSSILWGVPETGHLLLDLLMLLAPLPGAVAMIFFGPIEKLGIARGWSRTDPSNRIAKLWSTDPAA